MKKFLALLFVCAGLTAMAATPHVNKNIKMVNGKGPKTMVMKSNASAQTVAPATMKSGLSLPEFFAKKNVKPSDNLLNKAPRRVSEDLLNGAKVPFMIAYEYNADSGKIVRAKNYMQGGWTAELEKVEDGVYKSLLYFAQIPQTINVDLANNTCELVAEDLGGPYLMSKDTTTEGSGNRKTYTVTTVSGSFMTVDEKFFTDESAEDFANISGTIDPDGSLYFPEGWGIYTVQIVETSKYGNNWNLQSTTLDTIQGMYTEFYRNTYIMTPNATHSYTMTSSTSATTNYSNPAYMYQYDDTTAIVWNLWGFGGRGVEMYIHEDGTMIFPSWQVVGTADVDDLEEEYPAYDWQTYGYRFYNFDKDGEENDVVGTVNSTTITWDGSTWERFCIYSGDGNTYGLEYYPVINNVLSFTTDEKFLLGTVADPTIEVEAGDEAYVFSGVSEEGATVYLALYDPETTQLTGLVDNPYEVVRTNEEQVVYLAAYADGYEIGKNDSGWIGFEPFVVPALESTLKIGDVNNDGFINVADVTALISHVLTQDFNDSDTFNSENADINQDGGWNVADVTALINLVLNQ